MKPGIVLATDSSEPSGLGEHMLTLGKALGGEFDVALAAPANEALLARAARDGMRIKQLDLGRRDRVRAWLASFDRSWCMFTPASAGKATIWRAESARAAGCP